VSCASDRGRVLSRFRLKNDLGKMLINVVLTVGIMGVARNKVQKKQRETS
jgi:hypothetical protein